MADGGGRTRRGRGRPEDEGSAVAVGRLLRSSPRKLGLVAGLIRGRPAGEALVRLGLSPKKAARDARKVLESAVANAENNCQLDVDRLYVAEASVGKSLVLKRFQARARGRSNRISKVFGRLRVVVRESSGDPSAVPEKKGRGRARDSGGGVAGTGTSSGERSSATPPERGED